MHSNCNSKSNLTLHDACAKMLCITWFNVLNTYGEQLADQSVQHDCFYQNSINKFIFSPQSQLKPYTFVQLCSAVMLWLNKVTAGFYTVFSGGELALLKRTKDPLRNTQWKVPSIIHCSINLHRGT